MRAERRLRLKLMLLLNSENAIEQLRSSSSLSSGSIKEYQALQAFVSKVRDFCENDNTESQSLHLATFLEDLESRTWTQMKNVLFE